ncbi:MAG: response regulator transcription factor [Alphaproteobacteria bacterium]|nr:response regulator transcription factor [Alphaproteobacteria bacterium]
MPVVAVDDDPWFLRALVGNLEDAGYSARGFADGDSLLAYLSQGHQVSAILLDWQMPPPDGPEVLRRLRAAGHGHRVLFLTGMNQPIYEEAGLALGALDFVDKSKSFSIILHRLRIALERKGEWIEAAARQSADDGASPVGEAAPANDGPARKDSDRLVLGPLRIEGARAYWRDSEVPLTHSEFVIVRHLAGRPGRDVSYREIYSLLRGPGFRAGAGEEGYRTNVRAIVMRLRQKFRGLDASFSALENYAGYGYRWREGDP